MCVKPTKLLHAMVRWHVINQSGKKCSAATKNAGPKQGAWGTFPKDISAKLTCKRRAIEPTLPFITVEQISKVHHRVCSVA